MKSQIKQSMTFFSNHVCDFLFKYYPKSKFDPIHSFKLIAHRGAHSTQIKENTMIAFEEAVKLHLWGIEFDVRWTKDLIPIVHHDSHTSRIFNKTIEISNTSFAELRKKIPEIPSLNEVIKAFGHRIHLLIELKDNILNIKQQSEILKNHLQSFLPETDYHILTLTPDTLCLVPFVPSCAIIGVSTINPYPMAKSALRNHWRGHCGHYFLIRPSLQRKHKENKQIIGAGQINSIGALNYAQKRKFDWIFTDQAHLISQFLNMPLKQTGK